MRSRLACFFLAPRPAIQVALVSPSDDLQLYSGRRNDVDPSRPNVAAIFVLNHLRRRAVFHWVGRGVSDEGMHLLWKGFSASESCDGSKILHAMWCKTRAAVGSKHFRNNRHLISAGDVWTQAISAARRSREALDRPMAGRPRRRSKWPQRNTDHNRSRVAIHRAHS